MMKWTKEENELFGYLNGTVNNRIIAETLGKSTDAIRSKKRRHRLLYSGTPYRYGLPYLFPEQLAIRIMRENRIPFADIAHKLGRTTKAVRRFVEKNNISWKL